MDPLKPSCSSIIGMILGFPAITVVSMNLPYAPIVKIMRSGMAWLLLVALILRALIPVGYMPDFSAKAGVPAIRICGGHSHSNDPAHAKLDAPCSFSVNTTFSFAGVQAPNFAALIVFYIVTLIATGFNLIPLRRFGNASSRSPPFFS